MGAIPVKTWILRTGSHEYLVHGPLGIFVDTFFGNHRNKEFFHFTSRC